MELDALDRTAAEAFDGYIVRKDLVRRFKNQFPVPTYVVEFLLGRYCAGVDEEEIREGLEIVERQLGRRTVRPGEEELFKSRAREEGSVQLIDLVRARLDPQADAYVAELPSLQLGRVRIDPETVQDHERMLTGGFYAEVELEYDPMIAEELGGNPFGVRSLREIQLSSRDVLTTLASGRGSFSTEESKAFLLRSIGVEPGALSERERDVYLLRMVPFVERNYNAIELGPRGTGKSHLYQQVSPRAHLVSGGKTTVARMFVNLSTGQRGLVCQYDVVCFDEVAGISFTKKDGLNIMKGYMESGEFSRGQESIRAAGGIVMVGNFDVDVQHQQRTGHLFSPLPPELRNDTAFMDRIHSYFPGWDVPKLGSGHFTDHFGLVSDFFSECWSQLRSQSRASALQGRVQLGQALSGRDTTAVRKTVSGLLKLLHPDPETHIPDESLEWATRLALEGRRRVKEQQKRIGSVEFRNTHFSYRMTGTNSDQAIGGDGPSVGTEQFVATPELRREDEIGSDPLPPGQLWTVSPGSSGEHAGLCRIEVSVGPGSKVRILNRPAPAAFTESVCYAEQNLYSQADALVGTSRDPRSHSFSVQLRTFDGAESGAATGVAVLLALCGGLLEESAKGGLVVAGGLNLGGSVDPVHDVTRFAELAVGRGASRILLPVSAHQQLSHLPEEVAAKLSLLFYSDVSDALVKALKT
jgi:ATP-dependent Lon protease